MADEILNLVMSKVKQKIQSKLEPRLYPLLDTVLENMRQEISQQQALAGLHEPIQVGVKGVPWNRAFLPERPKMLFLFDYGDDWTFEVEFWALLSPMPN